MNGGQDLGGVHGLGPVAPEADEPIFHGAWEKRALGLTLCMGATGQWNIDASRHARENRPPQDYLSLSYYEIWLAGLEALMRERGLATAEEFADGRMRTPPLPVRRVLAAADVPAVLAAGGPCDRPASRPARFAQGDAVRCRVANPAGHTRMPRYIRGRRGVIDAVRGVHVFPDSNAHGLGENPQWLYGVRFEARDLWGADTTADAVFVDCFEPYLEPA